MTNGSPSLPLPAHFGWCGSCGSPTGRLTEDDSFELLRAAVDEYKANGALAALDALAWPLEMHVRSRVAVCGCPPLPPPQHHTGLPRSGFHLYRLWDSDDRLLYVGVSTRLRDRIRSHVRRWGDLIDAVTYEEHPDERAMLAAEREAIANEDPALNRAGVR